MSETTNASGTTADHIRFTATSSEFGCSEDGGEDYMQVIARFSRNFVRRQIGRRRPKSWPTSYTISAQEATLPQQKRDPHLDEPAKRGAEPRLSDLLHEAELLVRLFPNLRDSLD